MSQKLIGRQAEIEILHRALESEKSEFVAIYGRRRVGKKSLRMICIVSSIQASLIGSNCQKC